MLAYFFQNLWPSQNSWTFNYPTNSKSSLVERKKNAGPRNLFCFTAWFRFFHNSKFHYLFELIMDLIYIWTFEFQQIKQYGFCVFLRRERSYVSSTLYICIPPIFYLTVLLPIFCKLPWSWATSKSWTPLLHTRWRSTSSSKVLLNTKLTSKKDLSCIILRFLKLIK